MLLSILSWTVADSDPIMTFVSPAYYLSLASVIWAGT